MSDQIYNTTPSGQTAQNNNTLLWMILGAVLVIMFLFAIFSSSNDASSTLPTPSPQSTQIPQNPQDTQIPQNPQETQVPQNPQDTQIPQNPQETQVPQSTAIPTSEVQ